MVIARRRARRGWIGDRRGARRQICASVNGAFRTRRTARSDSCVARSLGWKVTSLMPSPRRPARIGARGSGSNAPNRRARAGYRSLVARDRRRPARAPRDACRACVPLLSSRRFGCASPSSSRCSSRPSRRWTATGSTPPRSVVPAVSAVSFPPRRGHFDPTRRTSPAARASPSPAPGSAAARPSPCASPPRTPSTSSPRSSSPRPPSSA